MFPLKSTTTIQSLCGEWPRLTSAGGQHVEVLIVDDCERIRAIAGAVLIAAGFDIIEASNGQAGLNRFEANTPDAIVTDINMPVMDGLTLIERVRAHPEGKTVPIIVVSANDKTANFERAKRSGIVCWLNKAANPLHIAEAVMMAVQ
ncbi:MAG: hypothetical protein B7Y99_04725 [Caulobacterales bacterium 32-69-10]|nr:MAG: hypothetical protein B7Y99_04725 [Caulobacterales bacterium 32-69-10]